MSRIEYRSTAAAWAKAGSDCVAEENLPRCRASFRNAQVFMGAAQRG